MDYKYDHFGIPVKEKREGMIYYPEYKVWCADYEKDPYRIEWIYFEKGTPLHPLIQTVPHVCFLVADIEKAVKGKKLLLKPEHYIDFQMAFIDEHGAVIEFIQPPVGR
jgi:hypothetical protein